MITLEELATKVDALERKVAKLADNAEGQDRLNTRLLGMVEEVRDDVSVVRADVTLLRRHAVATGQALEELDTRLTGSIDKLEQKLAERMNRLEEKLDANIAGLRRDMPSIVAEALREVMRGNKG